MFNLIFEIILAAAGSFFISAIIISVIILILSFILTELFGKDFDLDKWTGKRINSIALVMSVLIFLYLGALQWYGNHQIGNLFECNNYENEWYYANLFPEYDNLKNYRVLVNLDREDSKYYVNKVYFNEKQYLIVDSYNEPFKVNEKIMFESQDGREYYLELTDRRSKKGY